MASTKDMLDLINETERPAYEAELDQVIDTLFPDDDHEWRLDYVGQAEVLTLNGWTNLGQVRDDNPPLAASLQTRFFGGVHGTDNEHYCYPDCASFREKEDPVYLRDGKPYFMYAYNANALTDFYLAGLGGREPKGETLLAVLHWAKPYVAVTRWKELVGSDYLDAYAMGAEEGRRVSWEK